MSLIRVELVHEPQPRCWDEVADGRYQGWRWVASAGNGEVMAKSSERYTNRADCVDAIRLLFGAGSTVILHTDARLGEVLRDGDRA